MNREEKQLLIKVLCEMLPYEVKGRINGVRDCILKGFANYACEDLAVEYCGCVSWIKVEAFRPYLRPMSSMTEKEKREYINTKDEWQADYCPPEYIDSLKTYDWLIANHFDYRGLIPMGLALKAKEGMYKMQIGTYEEVKKKVIEIVVTETGCFSDEINGFTRFKEDLGTDSLDDVEFIMKFESAFGIQISDEEVQGVVTVQDVIDGISEKLGITKGK